MSVNIAFSLKIWLFCFTVVAFPAYATEQKPLENQIGVHPSMQVTSLLTLANQQLPKQPEQTIQIAQSVLTLARQNGDFHSESEALKLIARANIQLGNQQKAIDSYLSLLKIIEDLGSGEGSEELAKLLQALGESYASLGDYRRATSYHQRALGNWQKLNRKDKMTDTAIDYCVSLWKLASYEKALQSCFEALKLAQEQNNPAQIANALHNIGVINDFTKNYSEAIKYHREALAIREILGDKRSIADSLNNIGIMYYFTQEYDNALEYYNKALHLQQEINDRWGEAKSQNNIGIVYKDKEDFNNALSNYLKAITYWEEVDNKYELANIYNNVAYAYTRLHQYQNAKEYLDKAIKIAQASDFKEVLKETYDFLAKWYEAQADYQNALIFSRKSFDINNNLLSEESTKNREELQTKYQSEQKEREIELLKKDNNIQQLELDRQKLVANLILVGLSLLLCLMAFLGYLYHLKKKAHKELSDLYQLLAIEKDKTDQLLLNILPSKVANDLKEKGKTQPELFESVTVFFSDIVNFTRTSAQLNPKDLIEELNEMFTAFDSIIERNHCERIKTIGDAYLCVCGMPEMNADHALNIVKSAIEIMQYVERRNRNATVEWKIRVGIHSGSAVGGVVGVKKYIYDVFGDTINTASRMESNSQAMQINLSASTYELVKAFYPTIDRGVLDVKGKGLMQMYFIDREALKNRLEKPLNCKEI